MQGFAEFERDLLAARVGILASAIAARSTVYGCRVGMRRPKQRSSAKKSGTLARVRRRLERSLVQAGLFERRARWLCLLSECDVAFREKGDGAASCVHDRRGEIIRRQDCRSLAELAPCRRHRARERGALGSRGSMRLATTGCACSRPSWCACRTKAEKSRCGLVSASTGEPSSLGCAAGVTTGAGWQRARVWRAVDVQLREE